MRLSIPHVLRSFWLTLACALLLVAVPPLRAQTVIPNPDAAIENIADTAQNLGALGFAVVCLGIALVLLMIGILLFFWKTISPLLTAITASTRSRDEAVAAEREAREEQQEASSTHLKQFHENERETQALRTRQAEAMERIVDKMNENDMRSEEGRREAVTQINQHTDVKADELRTEIETVKTALENAASKDDIQPIIGKLDEIMTRLPQTDKLDASKVPATDPAASNADTPQEDTP